MREFAFLVDEYGFRVARVDKVDDRMGAVTYAGSASAVTVALDSHPVDLDVLLVELEDGELPESPVARGMSVRTLVGRRGAEARSERRDAERVRPENVGELLAAYASELRAYADDVLRGDVSVLRAIRAEWEREDGEPA